MTAENTQALGPFNRYVIWTQGCFRNCSGCLAKDSQALDGGYEVETDTISRAVCQNKNIEGVTISGGEPFLQAEALTDVISKIKANRDIGVILYTGYDFHEIKDNPLCALCDLIIDGPYIHELNDNLSLRGSSNQKIHLITPRYKNEISLYGDKGRKIELLFRNGNITMIGVPDKKSLKTLGRRNEQ